MAGGSEGKLRKFFQSKLKLNETKDWEKKSNKNNQLFFRTQVECLGLKFGCNF